MGYLYGTENSVSDGINKIIHLNVGFLPIESAMAKKV